MEGSNVQSGPEELAEQSQDPSPQVASLSQRLESLENSMRFLEDSMMTRLSALEERVEILMRRMEGFNEWSPVISLPTVSTDASTTLPTTITARQKNKQGILTARRVRRRYQRLVKSSWDEKSPLRRVMKNLEKKKRHRI